MQDKIQKVTFVILSYLNLTKCQNIQIFITHWKEGKQEEESDNNLKILFLHSYKTWQL